MEESILNIAKELIKKRPLNIEELFSVSINQLNYSKNEISSGIYNLILKNFLVKGSKISKDSVLKNITRNKIFEYISKNPGPYLREVRKNLNLSPHHTAWHLKILEKFGYIRMKRIKNKVFYLDFNINPKFDKSICILREQRDFKILESILLEPGIILKQLQNKISIKAKKLKNIISYLEELDLIYEIKGDGQVKYFGNIKTVEPILTILKIPESKIKLYKQIEIDSQKKLKIKPPIEDIKILREYDYVGGDIRFKVAIRNQSLTTITKINVMLNPSTQYRMDNRIQEIDILLPDESRGVDFPLVPLTCGKSKVYGSISYVDTFGEPHSSTIPPKEIWIKCPLVIPQKATKLEIENWKKSLLKGSTKIPYINITSSEAFKIACIQISALDLAEIDIDYDNLTAIFTGRAKVTGNTMIIEIKNTTFDIIIEVWTSDMKQATGFIAYIKNLINLALEVAQGLQLKMDKMGQTILDCFDVSERLCRFFQFCENREIIHEINLLLKEIVLKIERSFPDIIFLDEIKKILEKCANFSSGDNIDDKLALEFEYNLLEWLKEIVKIIQTKSKTYQDTFKDQKDTLENINDKIEKLILKINELERQYSLNILRYLMILHQTSGVSIFSHNFSGIELDSDLMGGFLTAIQSFGTEISRETTPIKKLEYKAFEISMEDGKFIRAALILVGPITSYLKSKLLEFITEFESKYENHLVNWTGNISLFRGIREFTEELFIGKGYD
ncbi:MAG: hypothetical protein ACFFDN_31450 [Candidatus Hodarchaeota archaeon]